MDHMLYDRILAVFFTTLAFWLFIIFCLRYLDYPLYSEDSWAYYELSNTIFVDFYRFNTWRQFWSDNPYSNSFPPAWPVIIAIINEVTGGGPRTGPILSALAVIAAAIIAEWIARHRFQAPWCGLVAIVTVFGSTVSLEAAASGRTETAAMVVALGCAALVTAPRVNAVVSIALGIVSGFGVMLRFDWLPCAILLIIVIRLLSLGWKPTLAYMTGVGLMVAPWVAFSIINFHTLFASDNRIVALAVDPTVFVTDWRPDGVVTAFEDPIGWLRKLILNFPGVARMPLSIIKHTPFLFCIILVLFFMFVRQWRQFIIWINAIYLKEHRVHRHDVAIFLFLFVFLGMVPLWLATGYSGTRYIIPATACATLAGLIWVSHALSEPATKGPQWRILSSNRLILLLGIAASAGVILGFSRVPVADSENGSVSSSAYISDEFAREVACLSRLEGPSTVLVIGPGKVAARFGALTGWPTSFEPRVMVTGQNGLIERRLVTEFLIRFRIGAVWLADSSRSSRLNAWGLNLHRIAGCEAPIYAVERASLER